MAGHPPTFDFKGGLDTAWAHDQELICANWLFRAD
jgi:hypothetical protein